jgi:glycosyltransferase involved in cell wall biosynthesis
MPFGIDGIHEAEYINSPLNSRLVRILFLALDVNLSGITGDSSHVRELANSLSRIGNELALVGYIPEDSKDGVPSLEENNRITLHVPTSRRGMSILRFCSRVIREFKPDVIYERRFSAKIGATLSVIHKLPLVIEINGLVEEELETIGDTKQAKKVSGRTRRTLRKRFFSRARKIVAVTEGIKSGLHEGYRVPLEKMVVVHNGANTELFKPMDKDFCRRELNLKEDGKYLLFVGNLISWQGIDDVIKAVPNVLEAIPEAELLIVGDGPQREELEKLAGSLNLSEVIRFTGFVPYDRVPLYMGASDICVAPKKVLGSGYSPLKLYEYMACGRPVVASKVEGFQVLEEGAGLLFEPDNVEEIASKSVGLLSDQELMDSMGKRGRKIAEEEYSWRVVAERVSGVLQEVVK